MLHSNLGINEQGHLTFAGQDTVDLAKRFGTALYLLDEERVRANCRRYRKALCENFSAASLPLYASKALSFTGIYRIMAEEGMGVDAVSCGEIYTALKADFPAERIYFHGNNKTDEDIRYAIDHHVGCFIVDNAEELHAISAYAGQKGITQKILVRLTPGIDPHTFAAVNTGKIDSQFGLSIETGQAAAFIREVLLTEHVQLLGYHCHIGSQIFDWVPFRDAAEIVLRFSAQIRDSFGFCAQVLNLGGGFGVRYVEADPPQPDIAVYISQLAQYVRSRCAELNLPFPTVLMEPGRSIVADAGLTLYTVGGVKTIEGYRSYVTVDGGMTDNPRYALYGSPYTVMLANRMNDKADFCCTVAGRCCESGAVIQENVMLPRACRGDILAVAVTGAYNFSMASNYNRLCRPGIVMLKDEQARVVVRRQTFADLTACDL